MMRKLHTQASSRQSQCPPPCRSARKSTSKNNTDTKARISGSTYPPSCDPNVLEDQPSAEPMKMAAINSSVVPRFEKSFFMAEEFMHRPFE